MRDIAPLVGGMNTSAQILTQRHFIARRQVAPRKGPGSMADSTSWVKAATRSIAERFGRAPPCWGERMPQVSAVQAIRLAMVRSRPFEMHESSAIGLQDRMEDLSFFPTFGSMATSASSHD